MIVVSYWDGMKRVGMLAFRETPDGIHAIGGFDRPSTAPHDLPSTVVTTDGYERKIQGWIHPADLAETCGLSDATDIAGLVVEYDSRRDD